MVHVVHTQQECVPPGAPCVTGCDCCSGICGGMGPTCDVFGGTQVTPVFISGRDTIICVSSTFNLMPLLTFEAGTTGSIMYGSTFGIYPNSIATDVNVVGGETFYIQSSNTDCMDTAKVTIILQAPEISGRDTTICIGESIDLQNLVNGLPLDGLEYGDTYGVYNLPGSNVTPTENTTYFVRDSVNATGCVDTARIIVVLSDVPIITGRDTSICEGNLIDLSSLIDGTPINSLEYGSIYGSYAPTSEFTPLVSTTYFVRDSSAVTQCVDTTKIVVSIMTDITCDLSFTTSNNLNFTDPCQCGSNLNIGQGDDLLLHDTLIISAPPGQMIVFISSGSSGFLDQNRTLIPNNTPFIEGPAGLYKLEYFRPAKIQSVVNVSVNSGLAMLVPLSTFPSCDCVLIIPTIGQWGFILLTLSLLALGFVALRQKTIRTAI